jgi:hypothetical protein
MSNYTFQNLKGAGTSSIDLTAGTSYEFSITNDSGSSYFTIETPFNQNGVTPPNTSGSYASLTNINSSVKSDYIAGFALPTGTSSFIFTPSTNVVGSTLKLRGTGGITAAVEQLLPVTTNLVLKYDPSNTSSYSGTGTTLINLVGGGLNGTLSNVSYSDPYLTYNGTNATTTTPDNALLEPGANDFSIETWINCSALGASTSVLTKADGGTAATFGYGIRIDTSKRVYFEAGNGTTSIQSPRYEISTDNWYQVVGVWTNVATNSMDLYVNGVLQGNRTHTFASIRNTTRPLSLGSFDGGQTFGQWFNGDMGIVRYYSKALSSSEVLQNYNANKANYGL